MEVIQPKPKTQWVDTNEVEGSEWKTVEEAIFSTGKAAVTMTSELQES